jgi:hypothetical protein
MASMRQRTVIEAPKLCNATMENDTCDRPVVARGFCRNHYMQARRRGDFGGSPCAVHDCSKVATTRGFCNAHYKRLLRHGDPTAGRVSYGSVSSQACAVGACNRTARTVSSGDPLCSRHYARWFRYGDPLDGSDDRDHTGGICSVDECGRIVEQRGLCNRHYIRWRRYGDPTAGDRLRNMTPPDECELPDCRRSHYVRGLCRTHSKWLYPRPSLTEAAEGHTLAGRWEMFASRCWVCGSGAEATDHVKPWGKGGPHVASNLRPICGPCNSTKRGKWPFDTSTAHLRLDPARLP